MTNTMTSTEDLVRAVLDRAMVAWTANDVDALAACYAADASVVLPGGVFLRNRKEIGAFLGEGFAGRLKGSAGIDQAESIRVIGADTAVVISLSGYQLPGEAQLPEDRLRRATWVLSRDNGEWLVKAYHNCSVR
jgi:uncharacterized protein (TIGR02246 family)